MVLLRDLREQGWSVVISRGVFDDFAEFEGTGVEGGDCAQIFA